jgi:hypothetical protein
MLFEKKIICFVRVFFEKEDIVHKKIFFGGVVGSVARFFLVQSTKTA